MNIENYIRKCYPVACHSGEKTGLDPLFILAQGAVESGWGKSLNAAPPNNNYFGIIATRSWKGRTRRAKTGLLFRCYDSPQQSFDDFSMLIARKYPAAASAATLKEYALLISRSAYISESNGDNREQYAHNIRWAGEKIRAMLPKPNSKS
jgi:flagellar protein FlgJ